MSRATGFAVSTLLHVAVAGAVLVNLPEQSAVAEKKLLPFNLSMLQSVPLNEPVESIPDALRTTESAPQEPAEKKSEPVQHRPVKLDKTVPDVEKKNLLKVVKKPKTVKAVTREKPREKIRPDKPPIEKLVRKVEPLKKTRPEIKPVQQADITVARAVVDKSAVLALDGARLLTLEQEFKQALMRAIENKKFYPRRAKRRRREGVVKISFTILQDGTLDSLRVKQSSGHRSLDDAAMGAVAEIGQFKPIPRELQRQSWDFVVPMRYALL